MAKPLTVKQAKSLRHGQELRLRDSYNADGTPARCRVTGKVQTWKTRPNEFRVPVKRGMYETGEITHHNRERFTTGHPASRRPKKRTR